MRTCSKCQRTKSEDEFYVMRRRGRIGLQRWCKICLRASSDKWKADNPQAVKAHDRKKTLKRRYGISPDEYAALLAAQNQGCAICGRPERTIQRKASPVQHMAVDHDHETGRVRGLLCQPCNRALGYMGDDVEGVRRFLNYLTR